MLKKYQVKMHDRIVYLLNQIFMSCNNKKNLSVFKAYKSVKIYFSYSWVQFIVQDGRLGIVEL